MQRFMNVCGTAVFILFLALVMVLMLSAYAGMAMHFKAHGMAFASASMAVFAAYGAVLTVKYEILPYFQ